MTNYRAGDIVLLRFPFTDLKSAKKRPAVIISSDIFYKHYNDVVVIALTSKFQNDELLRLFEWEKAGLLKETWIKPVIGTLSDDLIVKKIGVISSSDSKKVSSIVNSILDEKYR